MNQEAMNRRKLLIKDLMTLRRFVPVFQFQTLNEQLKGPEKEFFAEVVVDLANTFRGMPAIGGNHDNYGESAIVHLHYFSPAGDWWITERDPGHTQSQVFGLADLGFREFGYIPLVELLRQPLVEVDFHWKKLAVGEILK